MADKCAGARERDSPIRHDDLEHRRPHSMGKDKTLRSTLAQSCMLDQLWCERMYIYRSCGAMLTTLLTLRCVTEPFRSASFIRTSSQSRKNRNPLAR